MSVAVSTGSAQTGGWRTGFTYSRLIEELDRDSDGGSHVEQGLWLFEQ